MRLTREALPLAERVFIARHQIGKHQLSSEQIEDGLRSMRDTIDDRRIFHWGCFSANGQFMGYLVQAFGRAPRHWLMPFLATNPEIGEPWDYTKNGMDALWRTAIVTGRIHKRTDIVYSLPTTWERTTDRTQRTSEVWKGFTIVGYDKVPAGTLPAHEFDRWVFGETPKPYDVTLRCAFQIKTPGLARLQALRALTAESTPD
jgi:hypothetical protein